MWYLKCIHMVPSGYHSNVLIIKNYCDGFFADLGQGHSQNIQSFGLGGHLFWECPCPRALPHTWRHGNPFLGSLPCYLYFYECKCDLPKWFCSFFFRQECLKVRHPSMQRLAKGTPPSRPPPIPTTLGTHLGGFFWAKEQAFIPIGLLCWENACSYQLEQPAFFYHFFCKSLGPKH